MASSTTSAAGSAVTSGINVPEIVSGLMEVERVPITKLQAKVDQKTVQLSTLGVFKSKVAALETAARAMTSPGIFALRDTSSSNAAVAVGAATSSASPGLYTVKVAQTAQAAVWSTEGFSSADQQIDFSNFSIDYAGETYQPQYAQLEAVSFSVGDMLQITLSGGQEQSFAITSSATTPTTVAAAINAKVSSGDLEGVTASVVGGKLVVASSNPLQGVTVEHQIPGSGVLAGVSAFAANETLSFTVTAGAPQTFTVTSTATPAQLVTRVNDAVAAGTLSGVTAYLNASGEFGLRASDPEEGVSLTYTKTDTTTVSGTGTAAASLGTMTPTTAGLPTNVTLTDLVGWVDTLDIGLDASVIQVSSSQYALNIRSKDSGAANSLQVSEITFAASITAPAVSGTGDSAGGDLGDYVLEYDSATAGWTLVSSPDPATSVSGQKVSTLNGKDLDFSYTGSPADGDRLRFSVAADGSVGSVSAYVFRASQSLQAARDAYLSVNGLSLSRASNTIDDVVEGLTIDLTGDVVPVAAPINSLAAADFSLGHVQSASIRVTAGATDLSAQAVKDFANAYNELIGFYKTESASSTDPDARGVLNGDSSLRSYMERLRSLYSRGLKLADGSTLSFNSVGVEFQRDGKLYVDESKLNAAVTDGLQEKFAAGIKIGVESDTMNFTSFMTQSLQVGGLLAQHLHDEEKEQVRLQDRIDTLETKMTRIEERLYKQYAALDALLFRLQTTSNALASAIDSMTANQGG